MRNSILFAAMLAVVAVAPASAHNNGVVDGILGLGAGTALGIAIADHHNTAPAYQPAYAPPVPQPMPAPGGVYCQAWDGFRYVPVRTCR